MCLFDVDFSLICKKMVLIGSYTIRRCGVVGIGMAFLEELCHCGGGL